MGGAVLEMVTGIPGSGKSYSMIQRLKEFLEETDGVCHTNLPLNVEFIAEHYEQLRQAGMSEVGFSDVMQRVKLIPPAVEAGWRDQAGGPWEHWHDTDLTGSWIVLDEAHTFIGRKHSAAYRRKWQEFCGELRHRGCQLCLITQSMGKVSEEVEADVALWNEVTNRENERETLFRIRVGDWYQFKAKWKGVYVSEIKQQEYVQEGHRWVKNDKVRLWVQDPKFYKWYNSYAAPKNGGKAGKRPDPWEARSWVGLFAWFWWRNWPRLVWSFPMATVLMLAAGVSIMAWVLSPNPKRQAVATSVKQTVESVAVGTTETAGAVRLVGVSFGVAMFEDGRLLRLGEAFDDSGKVVACSLDDGTVSLSDGRLLRMSSSSTQPARAGGVRRDLQRSQSGKSSTGRSVESRSNDVTVDNSSASSRGAVASESRVSGLNRGFGVSAQSNRLSGSARSDVRASSVDRGTDARN